MATIDELLGPRVASSISDLLGPEPPQYFSTDAAPKKRVTEPEPVSVADDFLDARTFWKTEGGRFQRSKQTVRERLVEERGDEPDKVTREKLAGQLAVAPLAARGGLQQALAGVLRAVNAPPIMTWLYAKSAEQDRKDAEEFSRMIGGGKAGQTAMEFGSTGIQSLPALASAPAGLLGMAITAGAQTFGNVTEDAYQTYKAKDDPDALSKARLAGGLAGVVTAGLTRYMPGGTERFAQALVRGELKQMAAQGMVKTILKEAAQEFPEEALDQVSQGVIAKFSYRPETTWGNIGDDALKAGLTGSALAGFVGTTVLPAAKVISRLRRGNTMRESISTDEPVEPRIPDAIPIQQTAPVPVQVPPADSARVEPQIQQAPPAPPQVEVAPVISGAPTVVAPVGEAGVKAVGEPVGAAAISTPATVTQSAVDERRGAVVETPAVAQTKMQDHVDTILEEGRERAANVVKNPKAARKAHQKAARDAKEIKTELVQRLEEALEKAPEGSTTWLDTVLHRKRVRDANGKEWKALDAKNKAQIEAEIAKEGENLLRYEREPKITIEIPGDGKFTIKNTKESIQTVLEKSKRLSIQGTSAGKKTGLPKPKPTGNFPADIWVESNLPTCPVLFRPWARTTATPSRHRQ